MAGVALRCNPGLIVYFTPNPRKQRYPKNVFTENLKVGWGARMKISNSKPMGAVIEKAVECIKRLDHEGKVQFIILYGSSREGKPSELSDVDLAVGYSGDSRERFNFRVKVLAELGDRFDVQVFQDLPLYVRAEVLKGEVVYAKNMRLLNEIALETIHDLGFFKPRFIDYIYR